MLRRALWVPRPLPHIQLSSGLSCLICLFKTLAEGTCLPGWLPHVRDHTSHMLTGLPHTHFTPLRKVMVDKEDLAVSGRR